MPVDKKAYQQLHDEVRLSQVTLVAVSKTKPIEDIRELYALGHRDFGENYVQELVEKAGKLPGDIRWHFIGHLQTNKVKQIIPFVYLIHGVDSIKLLKEINKQAEKSSRVIDCLLQVHIAKEETKFGFDENELKDLLGSLSSLGLNHVKIKGLMGMASLTEDMNQVRTEFVQLKNLFFQLQATNPELQTLSMGMSSDYKIALEEKTNMVRIGSLLFGERNYEK